MSPKRAVCVIGWPVEHSRSPLIHNYWIRQHGLDAEYRSEAVQPQNFAEFAAELRRRHYIGANVTLPHKETALAVSQPDARAQAVGAANTLWYQGETLCSTNTDVEGFLANLDAGAPGWDKNLKKAVVLGAGGAAQAVVYGLLSRNVARIHVVNRTRERAAALAQRFGKRVDPAAWDELNGLLGDAGLLVNAASLGMKGQRDLEVSLPAGASLVVAELIYVPQQTALLKAARVQGLRAVDGVGMLLHQAVRGFELWFGVRPQVTPELRRLVEDDLNKA